MKTYVITLSKTFPATHKRHGEPTYFRDKFYYPDINGMVSKKLHTIRANYDLWAKRFQKIAAGEACLSVRQWTGAPYRSKQEELARLTREDGISIQCLEIVHIDGCDKYIVDGYDIGLSSLAFNDGLSIDDWLEWFKDYDRTKPLAIIHFTKKRY